MTRDNFFMKYVNFNIYLIIYSYIILWVLRSCMLSRYIVIIWRQSTGGILVSIVLIEIEKG